ncbi:unnamed protein product [marine sediment metagenome]|uniref:Uncharacterized protein n=1 Tax=marine sediment metagenome TaxID=412755 RepID=X0XLR1_9ZZZZ
MPLLRIREDCQEREKKVQKRFKNKILMQGLQKDLYRGQGLREDKSESRGRFSGFGLILQGRFPEKDSRPPEPDSRLESG